MANVEIIGQPIQATNIASTTNIEQEFNNEVAKRGIAEQPAINGAAVDSATMYETAQQYGAAAVQAEQVAADFAQQAERTAQEVKSLQLQDDKIKRPLGNASTTAAVVLGGFGGVELLKQVDKNIYNPTKVVNQALDSTVGAVGKSSNANPLNWINNLVNGSQNVGAMQDGVEAAVTKVSGAKLASAVTKTTDGIIQSAGIDKATQIAFAELDGAVRKTASLNQKTSAVHQFFGVKSNIFDKAHDIFENTIHNSPEGMHDNIYGLIDEIKPAHNVVATKKKLIEGLEKGVEIIKTNALNNVPETNAVTDKLLGSATEIKELVVEGAGGFDELKGIAEQDLREKGGKVAEFVMDSRDKFKNANPKIQMAIVGTVAVGAALAAYLGINAINAKIQKQHDGIEEKIDEAQQQTTVWSDKFQKTKANAIEAKTAANTLANWGDRIAQQEQSQNVAMGL